MFPGSIADFLQASVILTAMAGLGVVLFTSLGREERGARENHAQTPATRRSTSAGVVRTGKSSSHERPAKGAPTGRRRRVPVNGSR